MFRRPESQLQTLPHKIVKWFQENMHIFYDQIGAEHLLVRINKITHSHLKMLKMTSRCIPIEMTLVHKKNSFEENPAKFVSGKMLLCDIITGDRSDIYFKNI